MLEELRVFLNYPTVQLILALTGLAFLHWRIRSWFVVDPRKKLDSDNEPTDWMTYEERYGMSKITWPGLIVFLTACSLTAVFTGAAIHSWVARWPAMVENLELVAIGAFALGVVSYMAHLITGGHYSAIALFFRLLGVAVTQMFMFSVALGLFGVETLERAAGMWYIWVIFLITFGVLQLRESTDEASAPRVGWLLEWLVLNVGVFSGGMILVLLF